MNAIGTILEHQPIISNKHNRMVQHGKTSTQARRINRDTFEYDNVKRLNASTYSPASISSKAKTSSENYKDYAYNSEKATSANEAEAVQAVASTNGTSNYYDVIVNRAAKKAGVSVGPTGSPSINSGYEGQIYNAEVKRIHDAFWCQTGGWWDDHDGSDECMRTATATLVSINSGVTVDPTNVIDGSDRVNFENNSHADRTTKYSYDNNKEPGFTLYFLSGQTDLINAVNNELKNNRAVMVKTKTNSGYDHWVTITGTKNGKPATSYYDLVGVDPWYNGTNSHNPLQYGTGTEANSSTYSGVFTVSDIRSLNTDYEIITYSD